MQGRRRLFHFGEFDIVEPHLALGEPDPESENGNPVFSGGRGSGELEREPVPGMGPGDPDRRQSAVEFLFDEGKDIVVRLYSDNGDDGYDITEMTLKWTGDTFTLIAE